MALEVTTNNLKWQAH